MYGPSYVQNSGYGQPANLVPYQQGVFPSPVPSQGTTSGVQMMPSGQGYGVTQPYRNFHANTVPGQPPHQPPGPMAQNGGNGVPPQGPPPSPPSQPWGFGQNQQQAPPPPLPRPRNKEVGEVSPVLHMRNVDSNVTQLSIEEFVKHFGQIKRIVMLRQKHQALVEMESRNSAQELIDAVRETGYAEIDRARVYIRYSTHQELTSIQQPSCILFVCMQSSDNTMAAADTNPEVVHAIFSKYGQLRKVVVVAKQERGRGGNQQQRGGVQALVQFATTEDAEYVRHILQGQPVTLGNGVNFRLDIQFSRMADLKVINPMTSLLVDEKGNVSRPPPPPPAAAIPIQGTGATPLTQQPQPHPGMPMPIPVAPPGMAPIPAANCMPKNSHGPSPMMMRSDQRFYAPPQR